MNPAGETTDVDRVRPAVGGQCAAAINLLPNYAQQAETYDQTRSASGPILAALQAAIAGAPGDRLADIGGGTGNYALALEREGWQPVVIDRSPEMLALAAQKGLATVAAAAEQLSIADESFDAAILVSMLHHEKVLEQRWRAQTSYFERLQRDHPAELDAGLQQLEADVAAGCATRRPGRASILAWTRETEQQ